MFSVLQIKSDKIIEYEKGTDSRSFFFLHKTELLYVLHKTESLYVFT